MRITLDIDDDRLAAARELARREGRSAGQVASTLLRRSLSGATPVGGAPARPVAGFRPFPARPGVITTDQRVNALRDAEGV